MRAMRATKATRVGSSHHAGARELNILQVNQSKKQTSKQANKHANEPTYNQLVDTASKRASKTTNS
jgi:hypothetical protein